MVSQVNVSDIVGGTKEISYHVLLEISLFVFNWVLRRFQMFLGSRQKHSHFVPIDNLIFPLWA